MSKITGDFKKSMDEEVPSAFTDILRKGKIRCIIIYEDGSFKEFFHAFKDSYKMTIKGKDYIVIPEAFIRGKFNTMMWFYNNPLPLMLKYSKSPLTAWDIVDEKVKKLIMTNDITKKTTLTEIKLDSESLNAIFNAKILQGLYAKPGLNAKTLLIYAAAAVVIVLIILQMTGQVNVLAWFGMGGK